MLDKYHIVKHIKRRCQDATPNDMGHVTAIVKAYNEFVGHRRLKASACAIPQTVDLVGRLLRGKGYLTDEINLV